MANTDYIKNRTNQIFREKIALGMSGGYEDDYEEMDYYDDGYGGVLLGGIVKKRGKCPPGRSVRKAYTRKDGTKVSRSCVKNRKKKPAARKSVARKSGSKSIATGYKKKPPTSQRDCSRGYVFRPEHTYKGKKQPNKCIKRHGESDWIRFVKCELIRFRKVNKDWTYTEVMQEDQVKRRYHKLKREGTLDAYFKRCAKF